jgi:hypothetical protein
LPDERVSQAAYAKLTQVECPVCKSKLPISSLKWLDDAVVGTTSSATSGTASGTTAGTPVVDTNKTPVVGANKTPINEKTNEKEKNDDNDDDCLLSSMVATFGKRVTAKGGAFTANGAATAAAIATNPHALIANASIKRPQGLTNVVIRLQGTVGAGKTSLSGALVPKHSLITKHKH